MFQEPTSPEIVQAVSEADKARETKSQKRLGMGDRCPEKIEDDRETPKEAGITEQESDIDMTPEADITQSDTQSLLLESGVLEADSSWNHSLFQAKLGTNRRLHCSEAGPTEDCTEDYFDSLSAVMDDVLTQLEGNPFTDSDSPVMTASIISPVTQRLEESHLPLLGPQHVQLLPQPLGSAKASITPTTIQGESSHCFADNADSCLLDADAYSFEDLEDVVMEDEASLPLLGSAIEGVNSNGPGVLQHTTSVPENETCISDHCSLTTDSDTECSSTIGALLEPLEYNTATTCKEGLQTDHLGDINTGRHLHTAVPDLTSDTNSCASDSEWNELDCGCSPMTELHRQTLRSPALQVVAISDSHSPKDAFDCLKEVEFLEDKSSGLNPVTIHPRTECDESLRLDDSLTLPWSDQDLSWEDSEDGTAASTLSSTQSHKHRHLTLTSASTAGSPKQSSLFTRDCCVPDIAEQSLDWEFIEEDFDWD